MDARSLAAELAPLMIWQQGDSKADFHGHLSYTSRGPSQPVDLAASSNIASESLDGETFNPGYFFSNYLFWKYRMARE